MAAMFSAQNRYSIGDALLVLWDKYPSMRPYIVQKYEFLTKLPTPLRSEKSITGNAFAFSGLCFFC